MKRLFAYVMSIVIFVVVCLARADHATALEKNIYEQFEKYDYCCDEDSELIDLEEELEGLSVEGLKNNKYLQRKKEDESDLNTLVFKGVDGNMRAYVYQYPVKYEDNNGKVNDIELTIEKDDQSRTYISDKNSFKVEYSSRMNSSESAIVSTKDEYRIGLTADISYEADTTLISAEKNDNDSFSAIIYNDVFNEGVDIVYNPTYTGYKESIIVNKPSDLSEFKFILECEYLVPVLGETGEINLINEKTNEAIARFLPIVMFDSSEERRYSLDAYYTLEKNDVDDSYTIAIKVDDSFMNDPDVEYPIIIDPTLHYEGDECIQDATVYSGMPNSHDNGFFGYVGYKDSTYKIAYTLVNFGGLDNEFINTIDENALNYIKFGFYNAYGSEDDTSAIVAYRFNGPAWGESTVTYNSVSAGSNIGTLVQGKNVKKHKFYEFDITSAVLTWRNTTNGFLKGLILKNNTSYNDSTYLKGFSTVEFANTISYTCMPYVYLNYNLEGNAGPFTSADRAAWNFAENVYNVTEFSRIEYGATIYKMNNKYYYYNVHHGNPHNIVLSSTVPTGAIFISTIHTHPNSNNPSDIDYNGVSSGHYNYVVIPQHKVLKYDSSSYTSIFDSNGTAYFETPELTSSEKVQYASQLCSVWNNHWNNPDLNDPCSYYHCETMTWPNNS